MTKEEAYSIILNGLLDAKTPEDNERINDMADDFFNAGLLTEDEIEELFINFEKYYEE